MSIFEPSLIVWISGHHQLDEYLFWLYFHTPHPHEVNHINIRLEHPVLCVFPLVNTQIAPTDFPAFSSGVPFFQNPHASLQHQHHHPME